jgi:hypothetical protein
VKKQYIWIAAALLSTSAAAQVDGAASACSSPEVVLQRYIDAVGGKAINDLQSRTMTAKETNKGYGAEPERWIYKLKWKAPNKLTAGSTPYLFNNLPISYPNGTFIFDGKDWSDFDRRRSRNEEREPESQRELKHRYPYNEDPFFLELRVVADPLLLTRAKDFYPSLEVEPESAEHIGQCVLRGKGTDQFGRMHQDLLAFDAASGLLRSWQIGVRYRKYAFGFDDYRKVGAVTFPFQVYFDYYDATFRYTSVVNYIRLNDSEFAEKPSRQ